MCEYVSSLMPSKNVKVKYYQNNFIQFLSIHLIPSFECGLTVQGKGIFSFFDKPPKNVGFIKIQRNKNPFSAF